jgi:putative phage-type endonuclease
MSLTKAELEDRHNYIGSSDAAAALGLSRHCSVLKLWAMKCQQLPLDEVDSEAASLGTELEDYVARRFTRKSGLEVETVPMLTHPNYDFIRARPDRKIVGDNWGLECKTAGIRRSKEFEGDEIPQEYMIQVHHQMLVSGYDGIYIAYLIGNERFDWLPIHRDENIIQQILQGELNFWQNFVIPRIMPMTIGANDAETLLALFPNSEPLQSVELDDEANRTIEFRNALIMDKYNLEKQIATFDNQIKALLGNAEKGESQAFKVIWKSQSRRSLDIDSLKQQNPRIYNQFLHITNSRVLKVTSKVIEQGVEPNES